MRPLINNLSLGYCVHIYYSKIVLMLCFTMKPLVYLLIIYFVFNILTIVCFCDFSNYNSDNV